MAFWADDVADLKRARNYHEALEVCRNALPFPAAFQNAAICLRAIIKEQLKSNLSPVEFLLDLHELAAYNEFLYGREPTVTGPSGTTLPAFNVAACAHEDGIESRLDLQFDTIGYERLSLLKKTDIKLLSKHLHRPPQHLSPAEKYSEFWEFYRKSYFAKQAT